MINQKQIWTDLMTGPHADRVLRTAMWRVACSLSSMVGRTISNGEPHIKTIPLNQVPSQAGSPEDEMVGVYLVMESGLRGQAILILPLPSALYLADLMLDQPPGTATFLGEVERSALAEVGNLALSCFLNAVADRAGAPSLLRPSPPAVMVDMLGAILDVIVTPIAVVRDDLLFIKTPLSDARGKVEANFWVLPDPTILDLAVTA